MELFHATTRDRGEQILKDRLLKRFVERYYSKENSNGATTQGFVYLTNEITFSIQFANSHNLSENNTAIYVFKIDIPDDLLQPDEDEIQLQCPTRQNMYPDRLAWSLGELKSCRVAQDIDIDKFSTQLFRMDRPLDEICKLIQHAADSYNDVVTHYTDEQLKFLNSITWTDV